MNEEKQKMLEKMFKQEKMASISQLVASVAHEMNNPAHSIISNGVFLEKYVKDIVTVYKAYSKLELPADHAIYDLRRKFDIDFKMQELVKLVEFVKEGAQRIAKNVKLLKSYAPTKSDEMHPTDIHTDIDKTITLLNYRMKDKKIEIVKEYSKIPPVECNSNELNQVFMNLLANGIDAISNKGRITIETGLEDKNNVFIKISDTGEGIDETTRKIIYKPFMTTKSQGMGIGLSIVKKIIEEHRGSLHLDSEVGKGTVFKVTLPLECKLNRGK